MDSSPLGEAFGFVEEPGFLRQVEAALGSIQRWDEMKRGLDFALCRNPEIGWAVPGTLLRAQPIISFPAMMVYYTIDYEKRLVTLVEASVM